MKPSEALKLKKRHADARPWPPSSARSTPWGWPNRRVQPTGRSDAEAELLIQLPGVDDPAHVKQLLQTQAVLEWDEVKDGPFTSREEALSKQGGILPLEHQAGAYRVARRPAELVSGVAHPDGARHRHPRRQRRGQGELNRWETNFVLTQEAAKKFAAYTEANIGNRAAIVVDGNVH